jgi:hypothetical protein
MAGHIARIVQTSSFIATDAKGNRHWLLVYSENTRVSATAATPAREIEGHKSIRTAEGLHVDRIERGKYKVVETDLKLTSDDPDAF